MGEKVKQAPIDVTDFRKRYTVNRQSEGLNIKGDLKFEPFVNPLITAVKEKERADRVRS